MSRRLFRNVSCAKTVLPSFMGHPFPIG
jgi:hypothetical protein